MDLRTGCVKVQNGGKKKKRFAQRRKVSNEISIDVVLVFFLVP